MILYQYHVEECQNHSTKKPPKNLGGFVLIKKNLVYAT